MRLIHLLYIDLHLPKGLILDAFVNCVRSHGIVLENSLQNQLRIDSPLTTEIKKHIESGSIVPSHLIEQIVEQHIDPTSTQDTVIIGYPKSIQQLESFEKFARAKALRISRCWHFKHADFDLFVEKAKRAWHAKHGDDTLDHWASINRTTKEVESLKSTNKYLWAVVELTYENFNRAAYIEGEIVKNINA